MGETARLLEAFELYNQKNQFKPGDLVEWKPGMRHKKSTGPYVVMEVLEEPIMDQGELNAGSPYFRERLDIKLGTFDHDGDFVVFHHDSTRMQHIK